MERANLQAAILEGVQAIYSGMEAVARGTEAVERELDGLLEALGRRVQQPSKPPASKKIVANLPRIVLDEAKLEEIGRYVICPPSGCRVVLTMYFVTCQPAARPLTI
jgi:hypothetical protein